MKGVKKMAHRNEKLAIGATCFFLIIAITMMIATIALCCSINSQEREFKLRQLVYEEEAAEREAKRQAEIEAVKAEIHAETLARKAAETQAHEAEEARQEAEAKALAEAEARQEAESKAYAADEARQEAETKAQAADEARQKAETKAQAADEARQKAESKAQAADEARQKAESKAHAAETARQETESKTKVAEEAQKEATQKTLDETKAQKTSSQEPKADTVKVSPDTKVNDNALLKKFLTNNGLTMDDFVVTLTRVVYAEACGEQWAGKVGVAEVYLNWIEADEFHYLSEFENGYARISLEEYYSVKWSEKAEDREALQECERAVRAAIAGESPVEQLLGGVKPYYFYLPELSDPANVYVLQKATYQIWVGNQLYTGLEGVDWTLKTQYYQYQP